MEVYLETIDGAIEFWRIKENLQKHFLYCHHWSDDNWKKSMARGGGNKKRYQCCTDSSIRSNSCISELLKAIQDAVSLILLYKTMSVIPRRLLPVIFIMSDVQSIYIPYHQFGIDTGRSKFEQQTVFFQPMDPMDKNHKNPDTIDLNEPRHSQYMHKAWKKHQNTVHIGWTSTLLWRKN